MNIYFVVIKKHSLTEAIDSLLQYSLWFGVEPWGNDDFALQVKIENGTRLREITQGMEASNHGDSKL